MSLHLGNDVTISSKQIVGILNIARLSDKSELFDFLFRISVERRRKIGSGPFRSAVLCEKGTVYLSPIESKTLAQRLNKNAKWVNLPEESNGKNA